MLKYLDTIERTYHFHPKVEFAFSSQHNENHNGLLEHDKHTYIFLLLVYICIIFTYLERI